MPRRSWGRRRHAAGGTETGPAAGAQWGSTSMVGCVLGLSSAGRRRASPWVRVASLGNHGQDHDHDPLAADNDNEEGGLPRDCCL
jgi:hypothetical protein